MKKYTSILLIFVFALSLALAGCGGSSGGETPAPGPSEPTAPRDSIVIAIQGEPSSLDTQYPDDGNMRVITWNVFEPLYKLDGETLQPEPCLATDYEVLDDVTWKFTIREGVKWHDGSDFTVEDAVYSINRIVDPNFNSQILSDMATIIKAEAIDDKTLTITTDGPDPLLLKRLTKLDMVNKAFTETKTEDELTLVAMGTGPYIFQEWKRGQSITVTANENYWGGAPVIKNATFRFIEEPLTRLSALKTGEVDLGVNMYPEYAAELPKVFSEVGLETYWVRFNQLSGWMQDKNMRLAANYALDLQGLADGLFLGYAAPTLGQMGREGYFGFNGDLEMYPYDPAKAKELLDAAGYKGEVIELISERGRWLKDGELTEAVAAQLAEAGFNISTKFVSWNEWLDTLFDKSKTPDMQFSATSNEFFDMDRTYSALVHSTGSQSAVNSPELDRMIDEAKMEMDVEKRTEMYKELTTVLHEDPFAIYLLTLSDLHGGATDLVWQPREDSRLYLTDMSFQ